jgi:hypothetical protein
LGETEAGGSRVQGLIPSTKKRKDKKKKFKTSLGYTVRIYVIEEKKKSHTWWQMPIIPALGR